MVGQLTRSMCVAVGVVACVGYAPTGASAAEGETGASAQIAEVQHEVERRAVELTTDTALALESEAPFAELSIANPAIADISTISANSVYLLGKKPGRTTLMLMGEGGQVMSIIDVRVTPDISEFRARLAEILPGERIEAFTANDGIVLTGSVSGQAQIDRALALAGHYAPDRVSNLLTIEAPQIMAPDVPAPVAVVPDVEEVERHLAEILPGQDIRVHALGETIVLSGRASSAEFVQQAVQLATLASGGAKVSNMITVEVSATCTVRTRRGDETIETSIPCRNKPEPSALETAAVQVADEGRLPRPRPRPEQVSLN
ncbi:MAG: pilus assembly protein N-terminal domain-containing protein [Rhodobacteraceae bacterium]|nr:pilus assembly protein N-terminal domain-containing protein [Paracoccaceae bacterium]